MISPPAHRSRRARRVTHPSASDLVTCSDGDQRLPHRGPEQLWFIPAAKTAVDRKQESSRTATSAGRGPAQTSMHAAKEAVARQTAFDRLLLGIRCAVISLAQAGVMRCDDRDLG